MKKRLVGILAFVLVFSLCSMSAFAANSLEIEDGYYEEAANGEGSGGGTWSWDGAEDLQLNDFKSDSHVYIDGTITITVTGDNEIGGDGLDVYSGDGEPGDCTITGDGTLTVNAEDDMFGDGIWVSGDLTIEDTTVTVNVSGNLGSGLDGEGSPYLTGIMADNITVNNSEVQINLESDGLLAMAQGNTEWSDADSAPVITPGKITLNDCEIVTDGMSIRDVTSSEGFQGQVIAPGEGPFEWNEDTDISELFASTVTIKPVEVPAPSAKAAALTGIPATGDTSDTATWITVMLIAGSFIVSAISRKRAH